MARRRSRRNPAATHLRGGDQRAECGHHLALWRELRIRRVFVVNHSRALLREDVLGRAEGLQSVGRIALDQPTAPEVAQEPGPTGTTESLLHEPKARSYSAPRPSWRSEQAPRSENESRDALRKRIQGPGVAQEPGQQVASWGSPQRAHQHERQARPQPHSALPQGPR